MKVKVQFIAEEEIIVKEDGNDVAKVEIVKDAIQTTDFSGRKIACREFGKRTSNQLLADIVPESLRNDIVGYHLFIDKLHENNGEEIEIEDIYIPIVKSIVSKTQPMVITYAVYEFFDNALKKAKEDQSNNV